MSAHLDAARNALSVLMEAASAREPVTAADAAVVQAAALQAIAEELRTANLLTVATDTTGAFAIDGGPARGAVRARARADVRARLGLS